MIIYYTSKLLFISSWIVLQAVLELLCGSWTASWVSSLNTHEAAYDSCISIYYYT